MVYEKNKHLDANYSRSSIVQSGGQVQLEKVGRDVTGLAKDALGVNSASGAMDKISSKTGDFISGVASKVKDAAASASKTGDFISGVASKAKDAAASASKTGDFISGVASKAKSAINTVGVYPIVSVLLHLKHQ